MKLWRPAQRFADEPRRRPPLHRHPRPSPALPRSCRLPARLAAHSGPLLEWRRPPRASRG
eukprot:scaffold189_cov249-Pinguiococcus_pyrenoidosus.AAC.10